MAARKRGSTPPERKLRDRDYELLAEFRLLLRRFLAFSEGEAAEVGLRPRQHQALLAVRGAGGDLGVRELADRLCVRHHTAVGLVDRLVADGMVVRKPDPSDGRRVRVVLTAKGSGVLEQLTRTHRDELERSGPRLASVLKRLTRGRAVR